MKNKFKFLGIGFIAILAISIVNIKMFKNKNHQLVNIAKADRNWWEIVAGELNKAEGTPGGTFWYEMWDVCQVTVSSSSSTTAELKASLKAQGYSDAQISAMLSHSSTSSGSTTVYALYSQCVDGQNFCWSNACGK
jgi:hypothetical protein